MDYNKNNFHSQDNENQELPEGIFGNEEQFRAYAPEQPQDAWDRSNTWSHQTGEAQGTAGMTDSQDSESQVNQPDSYQSSSYQTNPYQPDSYQQGSNDTSSQQSSYQASHQTGSGYYGSSLENQYYQNSYHQSGYQSDTNFVPGGGTASRNSEKKAKKKHRALKAIAAVMAGVLLIGGAAGGGMYVGQRLAVESRGGSRIAENDSPDNGRVTIGGAPAEQDQQTAIGSTESSKVEATATMTDVSAVVESATPAIVAINCTAEYVTNFWGQQYIQPSQGSGSGIIIGQNKEEVLIVTNNHVVETGRQSRNETIEVVFGDESSASATIKGTEEGSDLAVVSVKLSDLTEETLNYIKIATLGDSDALKVGEMAIAIGNALGYGQSTTVGWISALDREVATEDYTMSLIQTDAAINPGNSGGALLNVRGEVIGINSAKYSDESVEGMGFAIPISKAIPIINDLMNREEIPEEEQAYLGIVGQDVPEAYNERYGMPLGIYVYQVSKGSPAEQAGLNMGDIITAFNERKVGSMEDLQRILASYRGGEEITLTIQIFEEGEYTEKILHVTLGYKSRQN